MVVAKVPFLKGKWLQGFDLVGKSSGAGAELLEEGVIGCREKSWQGGRETVVAESKRQNYKVNKHIYSVFLVSGQKYNIRIF